MPTTLGFNFYRFRRTYIPGHHFFLENASKYYYMIMYRIQIHALEVTIAHCNLYFKMGIFINRNQWKLMQESITRKDQNIKSTLKQIFSILFFFA